MPLDPVLVADTHSWLRKASTDLRAAQHDLAASPPLLADAAFHCQQAVEKSLKAFLMWHGVPFRKTHSLEELGEQCLDLDATLRKQVDRAVPLTEYAWKFRYPGDPEEPTLQETQEALEVAHEIHKAILGRLPLEVRT
ncbi:MAG: HEPN domain-containing protein [Deltaproteobacteria bacterium]|nr:HEPN domain-containing protein [Deltaproteobacteria bacterium]MBI4794280.1 HEPN domain-containing protein [Deltaproteobacteria bacterium]